MEQTIVKVCTKCGEEKSIKDFHKDSTRKDGKHPWCKSCRNKNRKRRYAKNPEKELNKNKVWRENNPEKVNSVREKFKENNPEYYREYHRKWRREKYNNDLNFKLKCIGRSRIYSALKGRYKEETFIELLDCTIENLIEHLESQFDEKMSWDNYGDWHVDHVKPCASFDLTNKDQRRKCFHYTNLQPLWKRDNLTKGSSDN